MIQSGDTAITLTGESGFASADVNWTVTGASGKTVTTGDGDDRVTINGVAADTVITGKGNDTIVFATTNQLTNTDTITGGAGTDTLNIVDTGLTDNDLGGMTGVEKIVLSGASTIELGAKAIISGVDAVTTSAAATTVDISATYAALGINAAALANDIDLTLTDSAAGTISVTGLVGDIAATLDFAGSTLAVSLADNTTDSGITLALGTSAAATTVTNGAAGDTVTITSGAAVTIDASAASNASEFVITGAAGAQTILASANGDIITGGAALDVITLGAGVDTVVSTGDGIGTTVDTIANFTGGSDIFQFDKSELDNAFTALMLAGNGATAIGATAAFDQGNAATTTAYVVDSATAFTTGTLETALEAGGSLAMTVNGTWNVGDEAFLVIYDDNVNTYLATVNFAGGVADDGIATTGDLAIANIVQLTGMASATSFTAADFQLVV